MVIKTGLTIKEKNNSFIEYIAIDKNLIDLGQEVTPIVEGLLYSIIENPNTEVNILHS